MISDLVRDLLQIVQDRFGTGRVKGVGHVQFTIADMLPVQFAQQHPQRTPITGYDCVQWSVHCGHGKFGSDLVDQRAYVGFRSENRGHRSATRHLVHQRAPRNDESHCVFKRHDARYTSGDKFSQAVPDHRVRRNAPGFNKFGQGIFDCEQRGLRVIRTVDQRVLAIRSKNHLEQTPLKMRLRQGMTAIHGIPKNGMRTIQLRSHAGMLRSLARKHESDRRIVGALQARSRLGCVSQPCREVLL